LRDGFTRLAGFGVGVAGKVSALQDDPAAAMGNMTAESACGNRTPMSLIITGRLPWSPSPDVGDLDVWYEYEYPYVGTFVIRDVTVLFNLLGGVETETTVWAYTCLDPDEARDLADVSFASLT
jgi:hypothetical protein